MRTRIPTRSCASQKVALRDAAANCDADWCRFVKETLKVVREALRKQAFKAEFGADLNSRRAPWTVQTIAGREEEAGFKDSWLAREARFQNPAGLAMNRGADCLYIADTGNHRVRKLCLNTGTVTTIAGARQRP
eukprot:jgi/Chlat1/1868/Chrsp141S02197